MTEPLIDPDCRDPYKHGVCAGDPCECPCHQLPRVPITNFPPSEGARP